MAAAVEQMRTTEHAGSNVLFLMIGAALAIYGSYVLNGLRTELHDARKFGQYQLTRKLGEGGMGEVYLAEHQLLKRPCALEADQARGRVPTRSRWLGSSARCSRPPGSRTRTRSRSTTTATPRTARSTT